ncbi:MAG: division/cell wall cluster transcriptional repressor MraZ [Fidelibacterota bacterium]|nr:MAG: division/cell wall cluster transcriptional repressor MraZ [Candidatus Neomarinimicrobiota bacterium]
MRANDLETIGNSFTGSYSYTLDAKGRINIPAKMRKALNPANDRTFMATRGADPCIVLYPVEVWQQIAAKLLSLNKRRALHRHYTRNIARYAEALQYDHQGRIALPAGLIDYAGIGKNVKIVGMIDHIEIWEPERLEESDNQYADQLDDLDTISDEIFSLPL